MANNSQSILKKLSYGYFLLIILDEKKKEDKPLPGKNKKIKVEETFSKNVF